MARYSWEEEANKLLSEMTLDEKISQMCHNAPSIDRLGIKSYVWWNEALHGVARSGVATVFPQCIGLAATFNDGLIYKIADCISTEARAKYNEYQRQNDHMIYKGLTFWSPNVNIFRDPRWGRGHETYGEDPFLTAKMGVAFIKGMQGNDPVFLKTAACAKHYAVHSGPEGMRHNFNAEVSDKDLYETYLPAFEACVKEAEVEAVMGAYNAVDDIPCCGNKRLLQEILRDKWGFKGHVLSDCGAIHDFHGSYKVTDTPAESAAMAVKAGCDLNCGNTYWYVTESVSKGLLNEEDIDKCVKRLLATRLKLGMIGNGENGDNESNNNNSNINSGRRTPWDDIPYEVNDCPEHHQLSLEAARESMVLLKNDGILPLKLNDLKNIAVIGPNADSKKALEGNYNGMPSEYHTVLEGIQSYIKDNSYLSVKNKPRVFYAQGCELFGEKEDRLSEGISAALYSDIVILCVGLDSTLEGESGDGFNSDASGDKLTLLLPPGQRKLMESIAALNKPVILVNMSGSAVDLSYAHEHFSAVVQAWYPGQMGGRAVAELLFGNYSPSGRLPVTFYRTTEELPHFEDYSMENRTYRYMKNEAFYPFGYGLSYSQFEYSGIRAENTTIRQGEEFHFSVSVSNTGIYDGFEAIQVYIQNLDAGLKGLHVPKWELCGFKKVFIKAGERVDTGFSVSTRSMATAAADGTRRQEPGRFRLYAGGRQPDARSERLTARGSRNNMEIMEFTLLP